MSTMIALFLVLSTLAGCASEALISVKSSLPPPAAVSQEAAGYAVELKTYENSVLDEDGTELANYSYEIPVMTAPEAGGEVCAVFNEPFSAWDGNGQELVNRAREDRALSREGGSFPYSDQLRCTVYQTERLVSVAGTYVTYTGGAHPNTVLLSWNFDLESGTFFDPATLDDDAGFHGAVVRALKTQAGDRARENGLAPGEFFWEDYEETLEDWSSYAVSFDQEGMTVGFSPYELAAYAAGPQVFRIPYGELAAHLGSQGRALLGLE